MLFRPTSSTPQTLGTLCRRVHVSDIRNESDPLHPFGGVCRRIYLNDVREDTRRGGSREIEHADEALSKEV
jgi:hypothetical protein